jgi:hypothetical protein
VRLFAERGGSSKKLRSSKSWSSSPHRVQPLPLPLIEHDSAVDEDGGEVVVSVAIVWLDCDFVIAEAGIELLLEEMEVLMKTDVVLDERLLDLLFGALESRVAEREGKIFPGEDSGVLVGLSDLSGLGVEDLTAPFDGI